jgi:hypothetical protein
LTAHLLGRAAAEVQAPWVTQEGKTGNVAGRFRIGSYSPAPGDSTTVYGVIDCDGGGRHSAALKDPLGVALQILVAAERLGLPAYLERSGGGRGWHVWFFFDGPVPAAKVRRLLFALILTDAVLEDGKTLADAQANRGIEVFPKQDKIPADGTGNMIWLPWWHGAADGGNLFYGMGDNGELAAYLPEIFQEEAFSC